MESPRTQTPLLKSITPRPIAESELIITTQLDKLPDVQYAHLRSDVTSAMSAAPIPAISPINTTTVLPMRPVSDGRFSESRTYVEQDLAEQQRFSGHGQQRFADERFHHGQKYGDQKFYDQRFSEQHRFTEQYRPDQRFPDQRYPDMKYTEQTKYTEQRFPDQKYGEQRFTEQRYSEQQRFQDGRPAEHQHYHSQQQHQHQQQQQQYPNPGYLGPSMGSTMAPPPPTEFIQRPPSMQLAAPNLPMDVRSVKANCYYQLQEVMRMRRQRHGFLGAGSGGVGGGNGELEWQIRNQTGLLLSQLKMLQAEVRVMAKGAQNHRWRRWLIGGFIATFIPLIRRLFRRGNDVDSLSSSNNTEYAFRRSKGLISRIKESVLHHGHWASMAFFVFSVLFIFSNEVVFRVSKTIYKRIRKLVAKIERSSDDLTERDLKVLEGWRWRVMLW